MSSMAKIFVVVNLVLGVVAFGSAATLLGAQDDYKSALTKANEEFEGFRAAMEKRVDDLNDQLGQYISGNRGRGSRLVYDLIGGKGAGSEEYRLLQRAARKQGQDLVVWVRNTLLDEAQRVLGK